VREEPVDQALLVDDVARLVVSCALAARVGKLRAAVAHHEAIGKVRARRLGIAVSERSQVCLDRCAY